MEATEHIHTTSVRRRRDGGKRIEQGFIEYLERLAGLSIASSDESAEAMEGEINRAALARLRRTLSKSPNEAVEAFPYVTLWVERALNGERMQTKSDESREWSEHCFYLVAALFAFYQTGETRASWHHEEALLPNPDRRNFGASFLALEKAQAGDAPQTEGAGKERAKNLERRFTSLLVSRRADLPQRLRHAVSLLKSENVPIDWVQLLADLQEWRSAEVVTYRVGGGASVQRRWAKSFWRVEARTGLPMDETDDSDGLRGSDEDVTTPEIEENEN